MINLRFIFVTAVALWIAGGLDGGASQRLSILGGYPDFTMVVITCLGMISSPRAGQVIGCLGGAIRAAIVGANAWQYMLTRTLAGWIAGQSTENKLQQTAGVAALVTAVNSLIAGIAMTFLTAQGDIFTRLKATILTAVYNGVLALGIFFLLERASGVRKQQDI